MPPAAPLPTRFASESALSLPARQAAASFGLARTLALLLGTAVAAPAPAGSALPELRSLTIEPGAVRLHGANRLQQLLITGTTPAGRPIDVTHLCAVSS